MTITEMLAQLDNRYSDNATVCVRLKADLLKALDNAVVTHNSTRSKLIQQALAIYLDCTKQPRTDEI